MTPQEYLAMMQRQNPQISPNQRVQDTFGILDDHRFMRKQDAGGFLGHQPVESFAQSLENELRQLLAE